MDHKAALRQILHPHIDRKLNENRAREIENEILLLFGVVKKKRKASNRTCMVATPDNSGKTVTKQVKPTPFGEVEPNKVDGIIIGGMEEHKENYE